MKNLLEVFLGILTAMGGDVEVGERTFALNGGSKFGYALLPVVVLGTLGIIVYGEVAGRMAAVARQPVFGLMRERHGLTVGLITLACAVLVNLMTCAAEVGGIAVVLELGVGWSYWPCILAALAFLLVVSWVLPFEGIERTFGLMGLFMTIYLAAAISMQPDWSVVAAAFIPHAPPVQSPSDYLLFAYYAVALLSAIMLPYEVYFYSSGGIEDGWKPKDIKVNRFVAITGFTLGSVLCVSFIVIGAQLLRPLELEGSCLARQCSRRPSSSPGAEPYLPSPACSSPSAVRPSKPRSRAATAWRSSSAGPGASAASRTRRRASRSAGWRCSCSLR
jgi:Mn2+/Fe2+ NRAMP family transporter